MCIPDSLRVFLGGCCLLLGEPGHEDGTALKNLLVIAFVAHGLHDAHRISLQTVLASC